MKNEERMEMLCDISQKKTEEECKRLGIEVYTEEDGVTRYTDEAQDIFNNYYDEIESELLDNKDKEL